MESRLNVEEVIISQIYEDALNQWKDDVQLIWLDRDATENTQESLLIVAQLRKVIDCIKVFSNFHECLSYIGTTKEMTTFIICSGTLGREIIHKIHDQINIWAIYIYCQDLDFHRSWAYQYSKVYFIIIF